MKKNQTIIAVLLAALILIAACSSTTAPTGKVTNQPVKQTVKEPIKLGFIGPLTGDAASIGLGTQKAIMLAVDEINAQGGIAGRQIKLISEDGKCTGKDANGAGNKMISIDGVNYIVGPLCSSETLAVAPLAEAEKTILLSPCSSSPDITEAGDYIFRNYPSDSFQGKFSAEYTYNEMGAKKAAIMSCLSDYCVGVTDVFAKRFRELGGEIVDTEKFQQTATDLKTELTKVKKANPDVIYVGAYLESTASILKQAKELGIPRTKIIGTETWVDTTIWNAVGTAGDGARFSTLKGEAPEDFKQKLIDKFNGQEVTLCAIQAYDAVYLLKNAIEEAGDDTDAVKEYFYNMETYEGISGPQKFDSNGDITTGNYEMVSVKDGKPTK